MAGLPLLQSLSLLKAALALWSAHGRVRRYCQLDRGASLFVGFVFAVRLQVDNSGQRAAAYGVLAVCQGASVRA